MFREVASVGMAIDLNAIQLRILDLLIILSIFALAARLLIGKSAAVAIGSIFVLISSLGICVAVWVSARNLYRTIRFSIQQRCLSAWGNRIKWTLLEGLIIVWLLLTILLTNLILENYVNGAQIQLVLSLIFGPTLAFCLLRRDAAPKRNRNSNKYADQVTRTNSHRC
jgi:hypothetical protein